MLSQWPALSIDFIGRTCQNLSLKLMKWSRMILPCIPSFQPFEMGKSLLAKMNKLIKNPDAHQKICQVAITIIQAISWYYKASYLDRLVTLLDSANLHDFYEFLKLPYTFTHWINVEHLNEYKLLDALERTLCQNWGLGESNALVRQFAHTHLTQFLSQMAEADIAYRHADGFREALKEKLMNAIDHGYDRSRINLSSLEVPLHPLPFLEKISFANFTLVSIGYVPVFLQDWKVIDLSFISNFLGQYRLSKWLCHYHLEQWVRIGLCAGFLTKFLEAFRLLCQKPSANQASMSKWDLVTSCTEFAFNFAVFKGGNDKLIVLLTFIAKSLGLLSIMYRPNRQPFEYSV